MEFEFEFDRRAAGSGGSRWPWSTFSDNRRMYSWGHQTAAEHAQELFAELATKQVVRHDVNGGIEDDKEVADFVEDKGGKMELAVFKNAPD